MILPVLALGMLGALWVASDDDCCDCCGCVDWRNCDCECRCGGDSGSAKRKTRSGDGYSAKRKISKYDHGYGGGKQKVYAGTYAVATPKPEPKPKEKKIRCPIENDLDYLGYRIIKKSDGYKVELKEGLSKSRLDSLHDPEDYIYYSKAAAFHNVARAERSRFSQPRFTVVGSEVYHDYEEPDQRTRELLYG